MTDSSTITVNAAHIILNGPTATGDIIIGQSRCDVVPAAPPPPPTEDPTFDAVLERPQSIRELL